MFKLIRESWKSARAYELRKEYDNSMSHISGLSEDVVAMLVSSLALEYNELIEEHGNLNNLSADYKKKLSKKYLNQAKKIYDQNMSQGFVFAHLGMYLEAQTIKDENAKYVVDMSTEMIEAALKVLESIYDNKEFKDDSGDDMQDTDEDMLISSAFDGFHYLKTELYSALVDDNSNYSQEQKDLIAQEAAVVSLIVVMDVVHGSSMEKIYNQSSYCFYKIIEIMADQVCDNEHDSEEFSNYFISCYTEEAGGKYSRKPIIAAEASVALSNSVAQVYVDHVEELIGVEDSLKAERLKIYTTIAYMQIALVKELNSI